MYIAYIINQKNMILMLSHCSGICSHPEGRGGKRGAKVPGYGLPGCGKHGVWWKTWGVENTGFGGKHGVSIENMGPGRKHRISVENTGSQWNTWGLVENTGYRGIVENTGCGGKHGISVENMGKPLFRPTMNFPH